MSLVRSMVIRRQAAWRFLLVVLAFLLVASWVRDVSLSPIRGDGAQNVRAAINLAHFGTVSLDQQETRRPSMYREPLPVLVSAAVVVAMDAVWGIAEDGSYFSGPRARWLKMLNVAWFGFACIGVYVAIRRFAGSSWLALLGVLLLSVELPLVMSGPQELGIDALSTEIPAAALLILASYFAATPGPGAGWTRAVAAGVLFGALMLVKASFMYVTIGFAAAMFAIGTVERIRSGRWHVILRTLVLVVSAAVVTVPWLYRNYLHFGQFVIAERGGEVLLIRAYKDLMNKDEYYGAFYVWSPGRLKPVLAAVTGFGPEDLQRGGRLQRLNRSPDAEFAKDDLVAELQGRPEQVISFYRKARAERVKLSNEVGPTAADSILQRHALDIIREHPFRHLAMTAPFLWRGAIGAFPLLVAALAYGMIRHRRDIGVFVLPAFGWIMFYGLLSHFIPRYAAPMTPVLIVIFVFFVGVVLGRVKPVSSHQGPNRAVA